MRALIARVGPCAMQLRSEHSPYEALVRAVAHQQLHGKAAEAILRRLVALFPDKPFPAPEDILRSEDPPLRGAGLSAAKLAAIRDIAAKTESGLVPTRGEAETIEDEALIARLVALRGVGRWTVEMMLIFTLGRPDIWPIDDFGVREGYRRLMGLAESPKPKALKGLGEIWRPHRSVAAWYLWRCAEFKDEMWVPK